MTRSTITALLTAASSTLLLSACDSSIHIDSGGGRGELKTLARLDCPEREDQLDRVSASADGLTCTYAGEGAEVRFQLVSLAGRTPADVLSPYEAELRALMPPRAPVSLPAMKDVDADTGVLVDAQEDGDKAHVRLPGISVDAQGDRAQVRIGGVLTIDADDSTEVVKIRSNAQDGSVSVDADENGAEIRTIGGEAGEVRSSFLLAGDPRGPAGWRRVGYEARGPLAGPIVVATIKSRAEDSDNVVDAMKDLIRKNIGQ